MRPLRHSTKRLRKFQRRQRRRRRASGVLALIGLIVLVLFVLPDGWPPRAAASVERAAFQPPRPGFEPDTSNASQIYYDDLTVAPGEVLSGDTVVASGDVKIEEEGTVQGSLTLFSGDVTIEEAGTVDGSLVTYSGDVEIERGGIVAGDISSWSGDVTVGGQVRGNIAAASGDVRLEETAQVAGDISVLSGELDRENGATVAGSVITGPRFKPMVGPALFSLFLKGQASEPFSDFSAEFNPNAETQWPEERTAAPWGQRLGWFVLTLIGATVFAFVAMLLSGLMAAVWPQYVEKIETISRQQLPLSFALGLLANVSLLVVSLLLVVLVCTIPFALVLLLGMVAINIAGWTALASAVGGRVTTQSQASIQPAVRVAIGALVLTAPIALLSAFGGCFRFIAVLAAFLLASAGAGAVVQDLLNQLSERNRRRRANGASGNGGPGAPSAPGGGTGPSHPAAFGSASTRSARMAPFMDDDVMDDDLMDADPAVDDFTRIQGIDEDADGRLLEAGITTFAQLAALTPEALADILEWPVERVVKENLIGRAEILAELS